MSAARADVREGGAWTRTQSWKNDAIHALARLALFVVSPLPARALRAVGRAIGLAALLLFRRERRVAHANVARVFPHMSARERHALVRRCYRTLGAHLGDAVALLRGDAMEPLPMDARSRAVLEEAHREGRGVIFVSAHLGPWERVAATLVARGFPLTTLARESYDPRFDALYETMRGGRGVRVIYRGRADAASRIVRTLRAGGILGAPMDLRSRVPSIEVPFLGALAATAVGPARIALRTGAAVVVGTVAPAEEAACAMRDVRAPSSLRVTCARIPTSDLDADDAGERTLTTRINDELSRRIASLPAEWPFMHPRFSG